MPLTNLIVDVYKFDQVGNYFKEKVQTSIPLPAMFVRAQSLDPRVYVYSKIIFEMPKGQVQQAYCAETVQQLNTRVNV